MKIIDLFETVLDEGGIKTAKVDVAAHAALRDVLPKMIKNIITNVEEEIPPKRQHPDGEGYDLSRHYDNLYNYFENHKSRLINPICNIASTVFTRVTKEYLNDIKDVIKDKITAQPTRKAGFWYPDLDYTINNIKIEVEAREASKDTYKDYGGYYSDHERLLKIFVNGDEVYDAAMELVQEEVLGESEGRSYNELTKVIVPVYVHEYAHLEQALRGAGKSTSDFGYITTGVKDRGRKGKRGGYMRSPRDGTIQYLRYKGNVKEIDSFASDAAAQLMHEFHNRVRWRSVDLNSTINEILQNLSYAYGDSKTFNHYTEMLQAAFDGAYADMGLKPEQMAKVWRRFAKRVYQKLSDYKADMVGKGKEYNLSRYNPEWVKLAKSSPILEVVKKIAWDVAHNIISKSSSYHYDIDRLISNIEQGFSDTSDAEQFLEYYYFGETWSESKNRDKMIQAFRNMVAKIVKSSKEQD